MMTMGVIVTIVIRISFDKVIYKYIFKQLNT